MKLTDLQPEFRRYETRVEERTFALPDGGTEKRTGPTEYSVRAPTFAEAQGIDFLCPKCYVANGNSDVGTHWCAVSFDGRGVEPQQGSHDKDGNPTRWVVSGSGFEDLSTQPSIQIIGGCEWHGFITNGDVS